MQASQVAEFQRLRGRSWGLYPAARLRKLDGANSIAWRKRSWTLVKASTRSIPYFHGNIREMPFLLMRHDRSRRLAYFFNVHNPVSSRATGQQRQLARDGGQQGDRGRQRRAGPGRTFPSSSSAT